MSCTTLSPGISSAVTTTTRLQSKRGSKLMERIVPRGMVERMVLPYQAPGTWRSSVYWAAPVTLAAPSRRGTERPMVDGWSGGGGGGGVTIMGNRSLAALADNPGPEARHLPNRTQKKMPAISIE